MNIKDIANITHVPWRNVEHLHVYSCGLFYHNGDYWNWRNTRRKTRKAITCLWCLAGSYEERAALYER